MSPQANKKSTTNLPDDTSSADFFARPIHQVARDLLGRVLTRTVDGTGRRGRIVEVEVYEGANDAASHARSGQPTERTAPMFGPPGTLYVYTIYGMYQCLNIRAPSSAGPGAVLIRACEPLDGNAHMAVSRGLIEAPKDYHGGLDSKLMSGPGKLCQAFDIGTDISGRPIGGPLQLEPGRALWRRQPDRVEATPRIGLNPTTCGECVDWPWRYVVGDCAWTSR